MQKFNIRKQIRLLYMLTGAGYFQIAGASWVALLAVRGFSLLEIGVLESIFHLTSFCFEIPSGAVADVWGRKKTMVMSRGAAVLSCLLMIFSEGFFTTAAAIGLQALSYNLASGTREALAYDSLKLAGREKSYDKFASTEMIVYRITNSAATFCAGLALWLGYQIAYAIDLIFQVWAVILALRLKEPGESFCTERAEIWGQFREVFEESWKFLKKDRRLRRIILINAVIGAVSTLVLFFLQAKLPLAGVDRALLGPALFGMGMGAALGARAVTYFSKVPYKRILFISSVGVLTAFAMIFTGNPFLMFAGGFAGAFADDFLEVRTDILINESIPSEQRATLVSVNSFVFSMVMIFLSSFMGWVL